jgi:2-polyprenyl-3-methyl-5-hydroxy-6-metoxy-1,4-benzoquinol methylase
METCYKAARTSLLQSIPLRQERFGFEPEITVKLAKRQARIYEVPVSYHGRTYEEGKKIGFRDAIETVWVLFATWLSNDIYKDPGQGILDAFADAHRFNRWMADTVKPYLGAEVLEIGAGMGNLSRHLAPRRKRYIASDIDEEHLARLRVRLRHRPNLEVRQCDLENPAHFAPLDGQLDSVVCLNVLEHVADEQTGLRNMHRVLRPGGTAVVLVPQGPHLMGSLDEVLGHKRRHTEESLRFAMQQAGFAMRDTLKFNRIALPGWWWNGKILKRRTIGRCQLGIYDRLVWLWRRVDQYLPWEPASIIGVGVRH